MRLLLLATAALASLLIIWLLSPRTAAIILIAAAGLVVILRYPVAGFVVLAFSVPWFSGLAAGASVGASPTEIVTALLGMTWLLSSYIHRQNPFANAPWTAYLVIFLLAITLSVTQATDVKSSVREILKWAELATVYLAGVSLLRSRRQVEVVLLAVISAGVSQALLGFLQLALSHGPAAFASERAFLRAYGTFDQPNPYAGYLNMVLPLAIAFAVIGPVPWRRRAALAAVVIAGGVLASESRGALLAGLAATFILFAIVYPGTRRLIVALLVVLFGLFWLNSFGISFGPIQRALGAFGFGTVDFNNVNDANFSAVERAAHWLAGVRMFAAHPLLGVGIGNYAAAYPAYHPRGWYASLEHAHNYYINIAAEAGISGLTAYLLMMGSALWYSCAATFRTQDRLFRAASLGLVGALVATSLHNVFDVLFVHGTTALIGLLMAIASLSFVPRGHTSPPGPT